MNSTPEPPPEQFQQFPAHRIIVVHPGSLQVRVGRASDLKPARTMHVVARRRLVGPSYRDLFIPAAAPRTSELLEELEECRLLVSHALQTCVQADGSRRYATPPQQIAAFNRRSSPEPAEEARPWPRPRHEVVVGDAVLDLDPALPYDVHFPYSRGEFHLHSGVGGSITAALDNMRTVWTYLIERVLGVPSGDLYRYRCVLLVPDMYERRHLKYLMSLLLKDMGFGHCFLVQESVGATFGAGIGSACVVDIGDQKTAISCVEDGISHKTTRLRMDYGTGDVCQTLAWMLQKSAFPYKTWSEKNPQDVMLMRELYEEFCHVNIDICGPQEKQFLVDRPGDIVNRYTLQVGDECIISPLAMFYTDLLSVTGPKSTKIQTGKHSDPEDPFDAEFLRETGRKRDTVDSMANESQQFDTIESQPINNPDEDIVVDALEGGPVEVALVAPGQVLGLDAAILQSIDRCPSEELKRKMYSNILIVGGGSKIEGLSTWLQNRLSLQIPYNYKSEQLEIVTSPKDIDPETIVWKGAAVMSCLESAVELWISQTDWNKHGLKILRERAPFIW